MKHIKLYEEFVNEAIDTKYWSGYNTDTSGQGDKRFADKSKNFDDAFDYAVEDWNNEADGPENKIKGTAIGKIQKLAKEFFKKEGWISVNVVQAMIMQEGGVSEANEINEAQTNNDYTFDNLQDYRKAVAALYNAGFYRSGNGNPPTGDETGTYQEDEHWLNLRIIDGEKDAAKVLKKTKLKYNAKYQKPTGYTVFNHGGHLD